jgi:hypothetical protein
MSDGERKDGRCDKYISINAARASEGSRGIGVVNVSELSERVKEVQWACRVSFFLFACTALPT